MGYDNSEYHTTQELVDEFLSHCIAQIAITLLWFIMTRVFKNPWVDNFPKIPERLEKAQ